MIHVDEGTFRQHFRGFEETMLDFGSIVSEIEHAHPELAQRLNAIYESIGEFEDFCGDLVTASLIRREAGHAGIEKAEEVMEEMGIQNWNNNDDGGPDAA